MKLGTHIWQPSLCWSFRIRSLVALAALGAPSTLVELVLLEEPPGTRFITASNTEPTFPTNPSARHTATGQRWTPDLGLHRVLPWQGFAWDRASERRGAIASCLPAMHSSILIYIHIIYIYMDHIYILYYILLKFKIIPVHIPCRWFITIITIHVKGGVEGK